MTEQPRQQSTQVTSEEHRDKPSDEYYLEPSNGTEMSMEEKWWALFYVLSLFIESGDQIHTFGYIRTENLVNEFVRNFGEITDNFDFKLDMDKYNKINLIEDNFSPETYEIVISIMLEAYKDRLTEQILSPEEYEALPKDYPTSIFNKCFKPGDGGKFKWERFPIIPGTMRSIGITYWNWDLFAKMAEKSRKAKEKNF